MDWSSMPADTMICAAKKITLRDVVMSVAQGADSAENVRETLGMQEGDEGLEHLHGIVEVFLPVIRDLQSGACGGGCGGGCSGCSGSCH